MGCNYPIKAYRIQTHSPGGKFLGYEVKFQPPKPSEWVHQELSLPCGKCDGCRLERSRQWALRCVQEASLHEMNCVVTLTYNEEHLPKNEELHYPEFQLFMKRLRRRFPCKKIRFFMCGEYGENKRRPHYHACIFGVDFLDKQYFKTSKSGSKIYRSRILEDLWSDGKGNSMGFATVGILDFDSASYIARYILKKQQRKDDKSDYEIIDTETGEVHVMNQEFVRMSLKPGIGYGWYKRWFSDIYPNDFCVVNGQKMKPPRYYKKKLKIDNPIIYDNIVQKNEEFARKTAHDRTEERLLVKEKVQKARAALFQRRLEDV